MPQQPLYNFGGHGSVMHVAVANGFPPPTYRPVFDALTHRYRVVSLPPRPLWSDPPPPDSIDSWQSLADDLLAGLVAYNLNDVIAVGHSFGAVASLLAVLAEPARFRALVLLDPTFLPPDILRLMAVMRAQGEEARMPLVEGALKRRSRFTDLEEAYAYWRGKTLFADWPENTLRLYAESITRPAADGDGLELAWSPEWEARYYQTVYTEVWNVLPRLRGLLPVLGVRGTDTNAFTAESAAEFRRLLPEAGLVEIEGHGHLFPHAAPDTTRQAMQTWLDAQGL